MIKKVDLYAFLGITAFMGAVFYCAGGNPEDSFSKIWPRWLFSCTVVIIVVTLFIFWVMKSIPTKKTKDLTEEEISQLKNDIFNGLADYSMYLEDKIHGFNIVVFKGSKKVEVNWVYDFMDINFDFFENGNKIYTDWTDFYQGETVSYANGLVMYVIKRYLDFPSRVAMRWKRDKQGELEVNENGQWVSIYANYPGDNQ